ncbi:hypothetical protein BD289DRAFT_485665 [Coniella lustricola]|uniref:CST complex subunit Stn1 N-terminal domain-containing protein n=1 Tax=Coniella lustricola TaxID=2025994 RepID=A0A2T2ZXU6_9PEZI|nr:hypothetical protein BD289DRAFT_485665 [Coniella lustricola]
MASIQAPTKKQPINKSRSVDFVNGLPFYPQYCFRLSPTINTYCHLQVADINKLSLHSGFGGQNVFFHHNHPVQWVRIAGIVVAMDDYLNRRIYTVDDSSGVCIECTVEVPKSGQQGLLTGIEAATSAAVTTTTTTTTTNNNTNINNGTSTTNATTNQAKLPVPLADIDVGTILDIKGGLALFRGSKQIKILKATVLRSTQHEVAFWDKIAQFRHDVLEKPWYLSDKEVRRCRKDEERR